MNRLVYGLALASVAMLMLTMFMGLRISEGTISRDTHMLMAFIAAPLSVITHFLSLRFFVSPE